MLLDIFPLKKHWGIVGIFLGLVQWKNNMLLHFVINLMNNELL